MKTGHPVDVIVDMGAEHSFVTQPVGQKAKNYYWGYRGLGPLSLMTRCNLGSHEVRHEFLYLPDCPVGLMGRDLLCQLRAQITFDLNTKAA
jgi:hypothetical protein